MRKYAQSGVAGKYRRGTSDRAHLLGQWRAVICVFIARMLLERTHGAVSPKGDKMAGSQC